MRHPEYRWIDVAFGGADKRNKVVRIDQVKVPKGVPDCYRTVFRYPDAFYEHWKATKSVSGYQGSVYADWLPIDIDSSDLEKSLEWARTAMRVLEARYDVDLRYVWCFFSGAKGFHLLLPQELFGWEPGPQLPRVFRWVVEQMFGTEIAIDLAIYDALRLFRLANTKHGKTGLYKVPLTAQELLHQPLDWIREQAKKPREVDFERPDQANPALVELWQQALRAVIEAKRAPVADDTASGELGRDAKPCIARMMRGVGEGLRNEVALRLAVHFRKAGMLQSMTMSALEAWNRHNTPPMDGDELARTVKSAYEHGYDFGCNDEIQQRFCEGRCPFKAGASKPQERGARPERVFSQQEARERYLAYVQVIQQRRIMLGYDELDYAMRGIAPGEVCVILARGGVGKTALALNIMHYLTFVQKVPTLFFSLEMPVEQVFERTAQIAAKKTGRDVEAAAVRVARGQGTSADHQVLDFAVQAFPLLYTVDEDRMKFEDLIAYVETATEKLGQPVRAVVVDYLGRMASDPRASAYERVSELALAFKSLAKLKSLPVIYLHQVSRAAGDGSEPVDLTDARDSGVIEEAADFVLGMWRPKMHESEKVSTEPLMVALLKNRRGPRAEVELVFQKPWLIMSQPDEEPAGIEVSLPRGDREEVRA